MELYEAIRGRRSVRRFLPEPIDRSILDRIVGTAIWAPSGGNAQTWRFVIVTEPERLARLRTVSPGLLGDPPVVIAICQDLGEARTKGSTLGETFLAPVDAAMAAQNCLLAAYAEGLGTCAIASFHKQAVGRLLGLPDRVEAILLVSVGRAAESPNPPPRRTEGVIHYEAFHG
jgi:albonoursin synthase